MPRAKPRPEDRQRSSKACYTCKSSKIRCDSELPCSSCVKRGRASTCKYSEIDRRRRGYRDAIHSAATPRSSLQAAGSPQARVSPESAGSISGIASSSGIRTPPSIYADVDHHGAASFQQNYLPEASNEAHIGETESLSFLHFLTKTLRPFVGNVRFTDSDAQNVDYTEDGNTGDHAVDCNLSEEQVYLLLGSYFEATSGLLNLFTADEINTLVSDRAHQLNSGTTINAKREDVAALNVALAIGAQTQSPRIRTTGVQTHAALFSRAQHVAFEGMLAKPSLSMVRLFLLMTFYMLGTCRKNGASMYLGVACKAADVLGLQDIYRHDGSPEEQFILRVSSSLMVVNILASFVLGRRQSTPPARIDSTPFKLAQPRDTESTFNAILDGCLLVETIVRSLRTGHLLHVPTAETLLEQLRHWTQGLTGSVRPFILSQQTDFDPGERQNIIGQVHLSCVHYFAVLLITRPFLIAYLVSRLRGRAPDHLIEDPDEGADITIKNNKVSKLAQVCVSSAISMIETLQKVRRSHFSFGNLCFLKAWVFGSGLVLGFSMFAGEPRLDIQEAFEGARDVLGDLASMCPQAKVYHGILTDFSEAVSNYRQLVASEIRNTVRHYVDPTPFIEVAEESYKDCLDPSSLDNAGSALEAIQALRPYSSEQDDLAINGDLEIIWPDLDVRLIDNSLVAITEPPVELPFGLE